MGSGSQLDTIFGHLKTKMEVKVDVRRLKSNKVQKQIEKLHFGGPRERTAPTIFGNIAGTGGPRNVLDVLEDI